MNLKKLATTFHSIFVFHFFLDERTNNQAITTPQTSKPSPSSKPRTSCFPRLSWLVRNTKHCSDSAGCSHRVTGYKSKFSCQITTPQTPKPPRLSKRRSRPARTPTKRCSDSDSDRRVDGHRSKCSYRSDGKVKSHSQFKNVKQIASAGLKFASFVNLWFFDNCNKKKINNNMDKKKKKKEMTEAARSTGNLRYSNTTCDMRSATGDGDDDVFYSCSDMFKIECPGGFSSSHCSSVFRPPLWLKIFVWLVVASSNLLEFAFFQSHQPKIQSSNNNNTTEAYRMDSTTACDMTSAADADTDDDADILSSGHRILSCSSSGFFLY